MKRWILGCAASAAVAGLAGFAISAENAGSAGQQAMMSQIQMMQACPMKSEGATLAVADTANGMAVTFTANPESMADLQSRVERMANMHNAMSGAGGGQMRMIAGSVKYDALPTGARLTFTPQDSTKLQEFREQIRSRVEQMKVGNCSMMEKMMQGMVMQEPAMPGMGRGAEKPRTK